MNGLKALKHIKEDNFPVMIATYPPMPSTFEGYTKDELFSIVEEELKAGEKYKEALEIIKKKVVSTGEVVLTAGVEDYNKGYSKQFRLTKKEYNLLKEVLK